MITSTVSVFLVVLTVLLLSLKISDRPCPVIQGASSLAQRHTFRIKTTRTKTIAAPAINRIFRRQPSASCSLSSRRLKYVSRSNSVGALSQNSGCRTVDFFTFLTSQSDCSLQAQADNRDRRGVKKSKDPYTFAGRSGPGIAFSQRARLGIHPQYFLGPPKVGLCLILHVTSI